MSQPEIINQKTPSSRMNAENQQSFSPNKFSKDNKQNGIMKNSGGKNQLEQSNQNSTIQNGSFERSKSNPTLNFINNNLKNMKLALNEKKVNFNNDLNQSNNSFQKNNSVQLDNNRDNNDLKKLNSINNNQNQGYQQSLHAYKNLKNSNSISNNKTQSFTKNNSSNNNIDNDNNNTNTNNISKLNNNTKDNNNKKNNFNNIHSFLEKNSQLSQSLSTHENMEASYVSSQFVQSQVQKDDYYQDLNIDFESKLDTLHQDTLRCLIRNKSSFQSGHFDTQVSNSSFQRSKTYRLNTEGNMGYNRNKFSDSFVYDSAERKKRIQQLMKSKKDLSRHAYLQRVSRFFERNKQFEPVERGRMRTIQILASEICMSNKNVMQSIFYRQAKRVQYKI